MGIEAFVAAYVYALILIAILGAFSFLRLAIRGVRHPARISVEIRKPRFIAWQLLKLTAVIFSISQLLQASYFFHRHFGEFL